jgi:hypothetical protein
VLQVFNGTEFIDLMSEPNPQGYEAQGLLGSISVKTNGNITITL